MTDDRISLKIQVSSKLGQHLLSKKANNPKDSYTQFLEDLLAYDREDHLLDLFNQFKGQVTTFYPETESKIEALFVIFVRCIVKNEIMSDDAINGMFLDLNSFTHGDDF